MKLPPPLNDTEIQELLPKLRIGDKETKERIISGYMRLAASIANRYNYYDKEIMFSAAWFGVCVAIDKVTKELPKHDNLTGFVIPYIHKFCREELSKTKTKIMPLIDTIDKNVDFTELYDLIDFLIEDEIERKIIDLKIKGFTYLEISNILDLSVSYVFRTFKTIQKRFSTWRKNNDN